MDVLALQQAGRKALPFVLLVEPGTEPDSVFEVQSVASEAESQGGTSSVVTWRLPADGSPQFDSADFVQALYGVEQRLQGSYTGDTDEFIASAKRFNDVIEGHSELRALRTDIRILSKLAGSDPLLSDSDEWQREYVRLAEHAKDIVRWVNLAYGRDNEVAAAFDTFVNRTDELTFIVRRTTEAAAARSAVFREEVESRQEVRDLLDSFTPPERGQLKLYDRLTDGLSIGSDRWRFRQGTTADLVDALKFLEVAEPGPTRSHVAARLESVFRGIARGEYPVDRFSEAVISLVGSEAKPTFFANALKNKLIAAAGGDEDFSELVDRIRDPELKQRFVEQVVEGEPAAPVLSTARGEPVESAAPITFYTPDQFGSSIFDGQIERQRQSKTNETILKRTDTNTIALPLDYSPEAVAQIRGQLLEQVELFNGTVFINGHGAGGRDFARRGYVVGEILRGLPVNDIILQSCNACESSSRAFTKGFYDAYTNGTWYPSSADPVQIWGTRNIYTFGINNSGEVFHYVEGYESGLLEEFFENPRKFLADPQYGFLKATIIADLAEDPGQFLLNQETLRQAEAISPEVLQAYERLIAENGGNVPEWLADYTDYIAQYISEQLAAGESLPAISQLLPDAGLTDALASPQDALNLLGESNTPALVRDYIASRYDPLFGLEDQFSTEAASFKVLIRDLALRQNFLSANEVFDDYVANVVKLFNDGFADSGSVSLTDGAARVHTYLQRLETLANSLGAAFNEQLPAYQKLRTALQQRLDVSDDPLGDFESESNAQTYESIVNLLQAKTTLLLQDPAYKAALDALKADPANAGKYDGLTQKITDGLASLHQAEFNDSATLYALHRWSIASESIQRNAAEFAATGTFDEAAWEFVLSAADELAAAPRRAFLPDSATASEASQRAQAFASGEINTATFDAWYAGATPEVQAEALSRLVELYAENASQRASLASYLEQPGVEARITDLAANGLLSAGADLVLDVLKAQRGDNTDPLFKEPDRVSFENRLIDRFLAEITEQGKAAQVLLDQEKASTQLRDGPTERALDTYIRRLEAITHTTELLRLQGADRVLSRAINLDIWVQTQARLAELREQSAPQPLGEQNLERTSQLQERWDGLNAAPEATERQGTIEYHIRQAFERLHLADPHTREYTRALNAVEGALDALTGRSGPAINVGELTEAVADLARVPLHPERQVFDQLANGLLSNEERLGRTDSEQDIAFVLRELEMSTLSRTEKVAQLRRFLKALATVPIPLKPSPKLWLAF